VAEIVGDRRPWTVLMISLLSMPWRQMLVMPRLAWPSCPLDHDERDALMRHLDRVRMLQLVRCETSTDASCGRGMMQLLARGGGRPTPTRGRSVNHAQQRAGWELTADLEPWVDLAPSPSVHSDLASPAALAASDEHGPAGDSHGRSAGGRAPR
jgi:hypothetical protein